MISVESLFILEAVVTPCFYKFKMPNTRTYEGTNNHLKHIDNFKG